MKIGVFDSGIGGVTVALDLLKQGHYEMVYLADQAHLPYGQKSEAELLILMRANIHWFEKQGITTIILACNTASTLIDVLRKQFPHLHLISIVEETARQVNSPSLLIVATQRTVDSQIYLRHLNPSIDVKQQALPQLAGLIESCASPEMIKQYLQPLLQPYHAPREILLACTHYPLVKAMIETITDCPILTIHYAKMPISQKFKTSSIDVYTTGEALSMKQQLQTLFALDVEITEVTI